MNENYLINNNSSYEYIKQLQEHAKQYDYVSDKKSFLKSIVPYEQKLVLLNSKNPYEVLEYLDELDIKATKEILNNLTYDEIKTILSLFSSEDKKKFYTRYSDLGLVNQFIMYDKNSSEYIDDLSFDRKVEIIDSSNSKTIEATSKVYETMTEEQRDMVSDFVTNSNAVSTLSIAESEVESDNNVSEETSLENQEGNILEQELTREVVELVEEKLEEEIKQEESEKEEIQKQEEEQQLETQKNEQTENEIEEADLNLDNMANEHSNNDSEILEKFEQAKRKNEENLINFVKNNLKQSQTIHRQEVNDSVKTI